MLEKEYEYFNSIRTRLVKEHPGDFVVIKDTEILGIYKTQEEAFKATTDVPLGEFLVQQCISEEESIQKYYSRVIFG